MLFMERMHPAPMPVRRTIAGEDLTDSVRRRTRQFGMIGTHQSFLSLKIAHRILPCLMFP